MNALYFAIAGGLVLVAAGVILGLYGRGLSQNEQLWKNPHYRFAVFFIFLCAAAFIVNGFVYVAMFEQLALIHRVILYLLCAAYPAIGGYWAQLRVRRAFAASYQEGEQNGAI